jgi:3-phenylpropionate/trans-cinnamate dioxygenase ferredoxin subunit
MGVEVRVCSVGDVGDDGAQRFDVDGHRLCVVHIGADWFVIGDRCSHQEASLAEGYVWPDEVGIECPKHSSTFDLRTGEPRSLPATKPVPVYAVRVDGDDVLVTLP